MNNGMKKREKKGGERRKMEQRKPEKEVDK